MSDAISAASSTTESARQPLSESILSRARARPSALGHPTAGPATAACPGRWLRTSMITRSRYSHPADQGQHQQQAAERTKGSKEKADHASNRATWRSV